MTDRKCPSCGKPITGHPNKKFCGLTCKDRFHNTHNPRGVQAFANWRDDHADYMETVHPFSSEAFEQ